MNSWQKIQRGFRALFRKEELDREMDEEMRFHLELRTRKNLEAGMPPEEARYAALRSFGGMEQVKEVCRDLRGVGWLETLWQDLRFGLRMLRKNPGFTAVAVLTMATREIGIRMGLGAQVADVLELAVRQGAVLTALGVGLGLSLVAARLLESAPPALREWDRNFLYGIGPWDPFTYIGAALLLLLVALAACWIPARRAAKVDPMVALRYE